MAAVKIIVVGAGNRGYGYADYCLSYGDQAQIVGVAEPRDYYREKFVKLHNIEENMVFKNWQSLSKQTKLADAVIISTQDSMHVEPAIAFANLGYNILLEKPMATSAQHCRDIVAAVEKNKVIFAVCHVMRYTTYTREFKRLLDENIIGDIVSMQHLEPVGYWHQAHSFVRGNWGREKDSTFMLLAKSCHDMDWISYIMGEECESISSFGSLKHFRESEKPEGAADRCFECEIERDCPYSAKKIYFERFFDKGEKEWPLDVVVGEVTKENLEEALRTGPYGKCVYNCNNDVVDHQIVNMQFANRKTASFTMTAFTEAGHRQTRLFGSHGQLTGDGKSIKHLNFVNDEVTSYDTEIKDPSILDGHGGGDFGVMQRFVEAVAKKDQSLILSGPQESLRSHLMTFAAEEARKTNSVINLK